MGSQGTVVPDFVLRGGEGPAEGLDGAGPDADAEEDDVGGSAQPVDEPAVDVNDDVRGEEMATDPAGGAGGHDTPPASPVADKDMDGERAPARS